VVVGNEKARGDLVMTPIWCRTCMRSARVGGLTSQMTSKGSLATSQPIVASRVQARNAGAIRVDRSSRYLRSSWTNGVCGPTGRRTFPSTSRALDIQPPETGPPRTPLQHRIHKRAPGAGTDWGHRRRQVRDGVRVIVRNRCDAHLDERERIAASFMTSTAIHPICRPNSGGSSRTPMPSPPG
jgi:hypothetical protein